ncbi:hypothetical protein SJI00_12625 [Pseudomonas sp. RP23018S]|uniref:M949_RS01915 family surface polysaccharide biosynthesis protein n=1 Tax=Pseudomonas sp. RP23018S TaxID=3096037 RepID=UPI002ACADF80|nr:hypothetical protein [Pseudomonas sp. RP23018S]MDZ5603620.1 hypothetical protein [Pseudomonas sp. RP23018S]
MPAKYRWFNVCVAVGGVLLVSGCEQKRFETLPPIPAEQLEVLGVQAPIKSVHFRDQEGEGLLVLSRVDGQATDAETEQEVDRVVLKATLYGRSGESAFTPRWKTEQETTCAGLDLDVDFYTDVSDVTDLDQNGIAEVTVASHAFCGGGIDPQDITIELRAGQSVYSLTGQSLISPAGEEPFGGEREESASYKGAPKVFREHLDSVWQQVYKRPWSEVSTPSDTDPEDDTE